MSDTGRRSRLGSWPRSYWASFSRPSLAALIGIVLVALAWLAVYAFLVTPSFLGGPAYGYFMSGPGDEFGYLTEALQRVARRRPSGPAVALIGSSATREAITSAASIADSLRDRLGEPVTVYNFCVGGLSLWEEVQVADFLKRHGFRGVMVFQVSLRHLSRSPADFAIIADLARIAVASPAYGAELARADLPPPRATGNYFLDHYKFFLARPGAILNLVRGPVRARHHMTGDWRPPTEAEWARTIERERDLAEEFPANREYSFGVYERLLDEAVVPGRIEVVLLEAVRNPRAMEEVVDTPESAAVYAEYHREIAAFAREHGAHYWDLDRALDLPASAFIDHLHIREPAVRRLYTGALVSRLAPLLRDLESAKEVGH